MISVKQLNKQFGAIQAVKDLSFQVEVGDVLGFLGPNGAGKTTTMKMLTGFLAPSSGDILFGHKRMPENRIEIQRQLGYLPEGAPLYGEMTVYQFLHFIADARGMSKKHKSSAIERVTDQLTLQKVLNRPIEYLSKGFKRRVGLAQAMIHDPAILILDEPTDGLDPNQKHQVRELIHSLSEEKAVIVSTHLLEEVTAVCNKAVIIAEGSLRFDGTPQELLKRSRYYQAVTVHFSELADISGIAELPGIDSMQVDKRSGKVTFFANQNCQIMPQISHYIQDRNLPVDTLYTETGRLDDVFRQLTLEEQNDGD